MDIQNSIVIYNCIYFLIIWLQVIIDECILLYMINYKSIIMYKCTLAYIKLYEYIQLHMGVYKDAIIIYT